MIPSILRGVALHDLEKIKAIARAADPEVRQLGTGDLSELLERIDRASLLLVDVRAPAEFAVSHLRDAVNLQTTDQIARAAKERNAAKTILYCSVGFRSSRLAHGLMQDGMGNVFNLEGSIFQWANEGRAIYQGEHPARHVHPYGARWAGLLKEGLAGKC